MGINMCEKQELIIKAVQDKHFKRKNRFIGRPPVCDHCSELAGKEYEFLASYPCETIKIIDGIIND